MSKAKIFKGTPGYGVEQGGAVVYEPDFARPVAKRLAELENLPDPPDWEHAKEILKREGLV